MGQVFFFFFLFLMLLTFVCYSSYFNPLRIFTNYSSPQNVHARAPLLAHLPSCSYTREKVRLLLSKTQPWTDPRETPITKSLHLLISLILRNLVYFAPDLVGDLARFETVLAIVAMSSQEAGRVLTDVLALSSGITADCEESVFVTHLPPFR